VGVINLAVIYNAYLEFKDNEFYDLFPIFSKVSLGAALLQGQKEFATTMITNVVVNSIGIIGFLVFGYQVRKKLIELHDQLDSENITPSDYALMAFNLPIDKSEEELKTLIYERFEDFKQSQGLEIVYINYTYNIEEYMDA